MFLTLLLTALSARAGLTIPRLEGSVVVDGDLADSGWRNAARVERFVEYMKTNNAEPPAKTVARIAYDSAFVYVAFEAHDPRPGDIRAPFVDRDRLMEDQDWVEVMIDTRAERRSAMGFRVNARGIQADSNFDDTI